MLVMSLLDLPEFPSCILWCLWRFSWPPDWDPQALPS